MIAETCSCGASFQADRNDELKLLNTWRTTHTCKSSNGGLAIIDVARSEHAGYHPVGFSPFPDVEEDDDKQRISKAPK